jgi:Zn-dependent protease
MKCRNGYVSLALGDKTAREQGRLTLNPLKHIDPVGLLAFVIIGFGWAKPVQIDPRNFKNPKWAWALSALAGPVSNFVIAVVFMFHPGVDRSFFYSNIVCVHPCPADCLFQHCARYFQPGANPAAGRIEGPFCGGFRRAVDELMRYERYGFILLLVLIMLPATTGFSGLLQPLFFSWLLPVASFAMHLMVTDQGIYLWKTRFHIEKRR